MASGKGKEMSAVVSIAGAIDPSLGKSIASAQKSITSLGSSLKTIGLIGVGVAAVAGVAAIGAAAYEAGTKLYQMGEEWQKSQNIMRIGTGKTGEDLKKLEKSMENVYVQFEGSKELIAQTIADANTLTDAEGSALEKYAINVLDAADMLKIDTKGLVESTSGVFKAFNIAADDMADMTDYIWKVGQSTGVGMDKLAADSQKNAAAFKELGLGAKQSIAMIGQMTKAGVDVESALAGMKKAVVNLNKVDKKTGKRLFANTDEAFQAMVGKISNAETEQEAMAVAMDVFGSKAGNEMAKAIREGKFAIADFVKAMDASEETIAKVGDETELVGDKFILMWHEIEVALKPLSKRVYDQFQKIAVKMRKMLARILPVIQKEFSKIEPYIDKAFESVSSFIDGIDADHLISQFDRIKKAIKEAFSWFQANKNNIVKWVKIVTLAFAGYKVSLMAYAAIVKGIKIATAAWTVAQWALTGALKAAAFGGRAIALGAYYAVLGTIKVATTAWTAAQWAINAALTANPIGVVIMAIAALIAAIVAVIYYWDEINVAIQQVDEYLTEKIGNWKYLIYGLLGPVVAIAMAVRNNWEEIAAFFTQLWDDIVWGFKDLGKKMSNIGNTISDTLKKAFTSVKEWAIEQFEKIAEKITGIFRNIKNFFSNLNPFGGGNDSPLKGYAAGGFTDGVSICGEAGTEAVISFDPAHRTENQGYLMTAAQMLGMVTPSTPINNSRQSVINLGGITFAPVINSTGGSGSDKSILAQLEAYFPEFMDKIEEALAERERRRYA